MASTREWVCIRLASYEHLAESDFLWRSYRDGMGSLDDLLALPPDKQENTILGLLAPDGRRRLSCFGRGPGSVLDSIRVHGGCAGSSGAPARRFATLLRDLGGPYRVSAPPPLELPAAAHDLRRALNVAACDDQPLVLLRTEGVKERAELVRRLTSLAWSEELVGRLQYLIVDEQRDRGALTSVAGSPDLAGVADPAAVGGAYVVQPGTFGVDGRVLERAACDASREELRAMLERSLERYDREVFDRERHGRLGRAGGVSWQPRVTQHGQPRTERKR